MLITVSISEKADVIKINFMQRKINEIKILQVVLFYVTI